MPKNLMRFICFGICFVVFISVAVFVAGKLNIRYETATKEITETFYEQYNELVEKFLKELFSLDFSTHLSYLY